MGKAGKSGPEARFGLIKHSEAWVTRALLCFFCLEELEVSVLEKPHAAPVAGPVEVDVVLVPPLSFPAE